MGAVMVLREEWVWYQWGATTPAEAAAAWNDIILKAYEGGCVVVDAPFWDDTDGDDAGDEAPQDEQDWYGVWDGETFVESLAYWAVSAFLATGISAGAAIKFITPLRKFRLTLKSNPHGAKLLVLMDSNIFQLVDLFSAEDALVHVDVVSPGSTLMLVHSGEHNDDATPDANGNYVVEVLKQELSETDVTPAILRINTETNVFQITPDGGTTWNDAPGSDPRTSDDYKLPLLAPYEGIECDVAARMTAQLKDTLDIFIASIDAAQFATGILALLAFEAGWVGWFVDLLLLIGNALVDIGQAEIEAAFTTAVYDDIRCAFFCTVDSHGDVTREQLDLAYDRIEAAHAGTVAGVIEELRLFYGDTPMVNAGIVRDETGDCTECSCLFWPRQFNFCGTTDTWTIVCGTSEANGIKSVNSCEGSPSIIYISRAIDIPAGSEITDVYWWGEDGVGTGNDFKLYWNGVEQANVVNPANAHPFHATGLHLSGSHTMIIIIDRGSTGSAMRIPTVRLDGTGTPPDIGADESLPPCLT